MTTNQTDAPPESCPFCKSPPAITEGRSDGQPQLRKWASCGKLGCPLQGFEILLEKWNTRAPATLAGQGEGRDERLVDRLLELIAPDGVEIFTPKAKQDLLTGIAQAVHEYATTPSPAFCPKCNALLEPKQDGSGDYHACRACGFGAPDKGEVARRAAERIAKEVTAKQFAQAALLEDVPNSEICNAAVAAIASIIEAELVPNN